MRMPGINLRFAHLGLRAKIYLMAGILTLFTVLVGIVGGVAIVYLQKTMHDAVGNARERAEVAANVRLSVIGIDRAQARLIAAQTPEDIRREAVAAIKAATFLDEALGILEEKLKNNKAVSELIELNQAVASTRLMVIRFVKGQNVQKAYESTQKITEKIQRIEALSDQIYAEQQMLLTERVGDEKISDRTITLLAAFVGITLLVAIVISYLFGRQLARSIREIQRKIGCESSSSDADLALAAHAGNVHAIAEGIASCETQMRESVEQIKSGVEEVAHSSQQTGLQVRQASDYIRSVADSVGESAESIFGVSSDFDSMKNDLVDTIEMSKSLQRSVKSIGDIVATISEVSAQTKLLSLNASIEAARAGTFGRGFAVVAGEVRLLASRTDDATQQIRDIAKNINTEVNGVVTSLHKSVDNATQYTTRLHAVIKNSSEAVGQVAGARKIMCVVDEFIVVQRDAVAMIHAQLAAVESSIAFSIQHSSSLKGISDGLTGSAEALSDMAESIRL
jgi:methyl-accepting chemotaxis protein